MGRNGRLNALWEGLGSNFAPFPSHRVFEISNVLLFQSSSVSANSQVLQG